MVVGGWCDGKRAGRRAIRERKRPARFERRQVAERGVRPDGVVVVAPQDDLAARVVQGVEDLLVQQLIAQAAVEAFDERVLLGLAGINVVPGDVVLLGPFRCADLRFRMARLVNLVPLSLTMQVGLL